MKLYHCFHDNPKAPWEVWLPQMTIERCHPDDRERLQEYLAEQAEFGFTPDVYYAAEEPAWGYGPFVQVIEISPEFVFRGTGPGEFIMPSDQIEDLKVYFNPGTDWDIDNPGLPLWKVGRT